MFLLSAAHSIWTCNLTSSQKNKIQTQTPIVAHRTRVLTLNQLYDHAFIDAHCLACLSTSRLLHLLRIGLMVPGLASSLQYVQQYACPPTDCEEQQTAPTAYPLGVYWRCLGSSFWYCDHMFAVKVVEMLRSSDAERRQRLRTKFNVYLTLEKKFKSEYLRDCIAPCCYGAFENDRMDIFILDLCDDILNSWEELGCSWMVRGATTMSKCVPLVDDIRFHVDPKCMSCYNTFILLGYLEPRNIGHVREGGFCLIDFSESRKHICKERKVRYMTVHFPSCLLVTKVDGAGTRPPLAQSQKCPELRTLRNYLWKRRPLQLDHRGKWTVEQAKKSIMENSSDEHKLPECLRLSLPQQICTCMGTQWKTQAGSLSTKTMAEITVLFQARQTLRPLQAVT